MAATLAARDITSHFLRYRLEFKNRKHRFGKSFFATNAFANSPSFALPHSRRGQQRLLSTQSDDEDGVEMTTALRQLPPLWADIVEEAHDDIARIKEKMSQLQKIQQRRLLKVFDDNEGESNSDKEIDILTNTLTHLFRECENKVKQIFQAETASGGETRCDQLLQKNAQRSIAAQLQALNSAFRNQQKTYLAEALPDDCGICLWVDDVKTEVKRRTQGSTFFEDEGSTSEPGFSDEMVSELAYVERETSLRQEELTKIARSVADLHQIFKDLSNLVIDQGTIVDRIDYNVEQVLQNTTQANVELRKAEERHKSGRAAKCIVFLLFTIFFLIVLLIMKHT